MAGTLAKINPYSSVPKPDGFRMNQGNASSRNMDEVEFLKQLSDSNNGNRRAEIIDQLRGMVRKNGGKLPFVDHLAVYRGFAIALGDTDWEVRNQCIQLINELIPHLDFEIDQCMAIILSRLIPNMGDSKITIRRSVIQTLHVYMKHTYDIKTILRAIVQHGLENQQPHIKKEAIIALPMLFTPEFAGEDFCEITASLANKLLDIYADKSIQQHALLSMEKIQNLVGDDVFSGYIQKLSPPLRKNYFKLVGKDQPFSMSGGQNITQTNTVANFSPGDSVAFAAFDNYPGAPNGHDTQVHVPSSNSKFEFGVIPSHIMAKLRDSGNFRVRAQAVEELKLVLKEMDQFSVRAMAPHVQGFIAFLKTLLDDSNFKITTVTLEIMGYLIERQGASIKPHLKMLSAIMTKPMSDTKVVIRQAIMKVIMQLMHIFSPKDILGIMCENLSHRNSRVRQETLNIVIASLLTFPSYDFDLSELCQKVAHTLVDPKRQVRQAALECFAVIASNLGAGKLQPLVAAVDAVELSNDGDGVMGAVQARLARRLLPKLGIEGLVEYATPVPTSAGIRGGSVNLPPGADIEWILSASGGLGSSARSNRSDLELESVGSSAASSARSTPAPPYSENYGPTPRRYMSAGKGKNRLPWDESEHGENQENGQHATSPNKMVQRQKQLANSSPSSRDQSPDTGNSYRQMYLKNRDKRGPAQTEAVAQPFSMYNPSKDEEGHSAYSTPRNTLDYSHEPSTKPGKRILEPIADNENEGGSPSQYTPPSKPALARGTSSRSSSKRKVPPIALGGGKVRGGAPSQEELDSARDSIADGIIDDEGDDEMHNSIRQIRHSATRKKVDKIFEKLDTNLSKAQRKKSPAQRSPSPETTYADSGFSSNMSTLRSDFDQVDSVKASPGYSMAANKKAKKTENPFEAKPRLARKPSVHKPENNGSSNKSVSGPVGTRHSSSSSSLTGTPNTFDYSPHGGVTFKENPNLNLQMVGTGYGEDSHPVDPKPSQHASKAKDRRRVSKGSSFGGLGGSGSQTSFDPDDPEESPSIIGKGILDNSAVRASDAGQPGAAGRGLVGVYGVRVRTNSENEPNEEEDDQIAISQATRAAMQLKVKARKEEAERAREERERMICQRREEAQQEREKLRQLQERDRLRIQTEAEERQKNAMEEEHARQKDRLRQLAPNSEQDDLSGLAVSGSSSQPNASRPRPPPGNKPGVDTPSVKRKTRPATDNGDKSSHEPEARDMLPPYRDTTGVLDEVMKAIPDKNVEWDRKCQALNSVRRLALHHSDLLVPNMHALVLAVVEEVKNLRSQVSRLGIITIGELLYAYKKPIEPDLDVITKVLLHKAGEANEFIREDVTRAINNMVENSHPQRAMLAIIAGCADHRNPTVRSTAANFLVPLVYKMGPARLLSGIKDVTDRILPTAANFLLDGNPETRYCGMQIFHLLMSHGEFEDCLKKHLSPNLKRNIQEKLDSLKKKGLSEPPPESSSARKGRSGMVRSGNNSRYNSAHSSGTDSTPNSSKRRSGVVRTDESTMEEIKEFCAKMGAGDWRQRAEGIDELMDMMRRSPDVVGANITKIFDKFVPCLKDANSKVNLVSLRAMIDMCVPLREYMSNVITYTIATIATNLSSKNKEIYESAAEALDCIMENIDHSIILQPFCQQASSANTRIKPDMTERVSYIASELLDTKPKTVVMHALPVLWGLLEKATPGRAGAEEGTVRYATIRMVQTLYHKMGNELLTHAQNTSTVTPRSLQILDDMLTIQL